MRRCMYTCVTGLAGAAMRPGLITAAEAGAVKETAPNTVAAAIARNEARKTIPFHIAMMIQVPIII